MRDNDLQAGRMLQTTDGTRGGHSRSLAVAASGKSILRTVGETVGRNVSGRVSDASGGSVDRVSGTSGGLVLRCVGGMLCAVLVASGCSDDGSTPVESVTTTIPSTTAASITSVPDGSTPLPTTLVAQRSTTPASTAPPTTLVAAPSTAPPTTTVGLLGEDDHVFAAIRRYFEVLVEANDPPDPNSTLWDDVATPDRADALRAKARENLAARRGVRWPVDRRPLLHAPATVLRRDSIAVVDTCVRDGLVTYDLDTDAVIDDSILYFWAQLTVTDHFGGLLVSQYRKIQEFESEGPCIDAYR